MAGPNPLVRAPINGIFVVALLYCNKLLMMRRLSATVFIGIAVVISLFTDTYGFPSPLKIVFVGCGFIFDAGTFFRTRALRWWNLFVGLVMGITENGHVKSPANYDDNAVVENHLVPDRQGCRLTLCVIC